MALLDTGLDPAIAAYIAEFTVEPYPELTRLREWIDRHDDPIQISPEQGAFLAFLVRITKARRVFEIGSHHGYAAVWIGSALPADGRLTTVEIDPERAASARSWIDRVGLTRRIEVVADDARRVLEDVPDDGQDIVFIDAFKVDYPEYLDHAVRITRPGGLIVADNTLHKGRVALANPRRAQTVSIKSYNETVFGRADLVSVLIPIGDGFTLSAVVAKW